MLHHLLSYWSDPLATFENQLREGQEDSECLHLGWFVKCVLDSVGEEVQIVGEELQKKQPPGDALQSHSCLSEVNILM